MVNFTFRLGIKSIVLEKASSLRTSGAAFIMWANAWKALDALGVADSLRPNYCQLDGYFSFSIYQFDQQWVSFYSIFGLSFKI